MSRVKDKLMLSIHQDGASTAYMYSAKVAVPQLLMPLKLPTYRGWPHGAGGAQWRGLHDP